MDNNSKNKLSILHFTPYAFIDTHTYPEAIVAKELVWYGHQLTQVRCRGIYAKNCISMSAAGVNFSSPELEKKAICNICIRKSSQIQKIFKFETIYIDDYIEPSDIDKINGILNSVTSSNWIDLIFEGLAIGRIASYEFLLGHKLSTFTIDIKYLDDYKAALYNTFLTAIVAQKLSKLIKVDRIFSYNNFYSCNHVFSEVFHQSQNSLIYTVHAGGHHKYRVSELTIFGGYTDQIIINRSKAWLDSSSKSLSTKQIKYVSRHVSELLDAKSPWVYSVISNNISSGDLKARIGIPPNAKVLIALMASGDERFAAKVAGVFPSGSFKSIFEDQLEWVNWLISYANSNPSIFLIIRPHPREFPNKRESVLSSQALTLEQRFKNLPKNVYINWPSDNISLHDLIKVVDVGLNESSTSGLELLLFGIPVVVHDPDTLFSYPVEFNYIANSKNDYLIKIEDAIQNGHSVEHIIRAYRWLSFKSEIVAISILDVYRTKRSFLFRVIDKLIRLIVTKYLYIYIDLSFNYFFLLTGAKNSKYLIFAISSGKVSHMDSAISALKNVGHENECLERATILLQTKNYFKKISYEPQF